MSVRYIRDIFVKAWPTVILQKRVAARFHLWTSEVHKSKCAAGLFGLLPLDVAFTKMPLIYLTQTHKLISSLTLTYLISLLFTPHALTPTPPSLTCISALCSALYSVVSFFLFFFFLSFVFFNAILIFFFFLISV